MISVQLCLAQATKPALDTDSTFRRALQEIRYPELRRLAQQTTIVFVQFTLTPQGKVTQIKYLNEDEVDNPFVYEVQQIVEQLPTLPALYAGEYVLPVGFESENSQGKKRLTKEDRAALARTFVQLTRARVLLSEVYVPASNW